jgi:hypothetical protein
MEETQQESKQPNCLLHRSYATTEHYNQEIWLRQVTSTNTFGTKKMLQLLAILQYIFLDLGLEFCLVWQIQHSKQLVYRAEETTYMGSG